MNDAPDQPPPMNPDGKDQPLPMNPDGNEQPLIPAFSPYEGEKVNLSLVCEHANGLDIRSKQVHGFNAGNSVRGILTPPSPLMKGRG